MTCPDKKLSGTIGTGHFLPFQTFSPSCTLKPPLEEDPLSQSEEALVITVFSYSDVKSPAGCCKAICLLVRAEYVSVMDHSRKMHVGFLHCEQTKHCDFLWGRKMHGRSFKIFGKKFL